MDGICHNWSRVNGYCKYGPNCNYRHDGPQGGKKRNAEAASLLTSGGTKKSRKKLVSLLMKDLKESFDGERKGLEQGHDGDEEAHIYKSIRGAPTVMFMKGGDDGHDYVPEWDNKLEGDTSNEEGDDEMGTEQEMETVHFNVTLMMNQ